jgi:hypothetical protein
MGKVNFKTIDLNGFWDKEEKIDFNPGTIIQREALSKIFKRINEKYVEVITGPRQTGKTTLLNLLMHKLQVQNKRYDNLFYTNLDTIIDHRIFENPLYFYEHISKSFAPKNRINYIFIDEVQRLKNPGQFLKGLFDLNKNVKLFVSGSSSLELKSKTKEFLTGRKRETILLPISFPEIIKHEGKIKDDISCLKITGKTISCWQKNELFYGKYLSGKIKEHMFFGSYPGILTKTNNESKAEELNELFNSYIKKDVVDYLKVERIEIFNNLVKVLSAQIGNLINHSELCSITQGNAVTITKYLNILENTFVTYYLKPLTTNRRNEVKHAGKCYFVDNGMRNFALRQFNENENRTDYGALLENLIVSETLKNRNIDEEIYYWRTKSGAEIDMIIQKEGQLIPVEIKSGTINIGTLTKSFYSFLNFFSPKKAVFINKDKFGIIQVNKTTVYYIPAKWFLLYKTSLI